MITTTGVRRLIALAAAVFATGPWAYADTTYRLGSSGFTATGAMTNGVWWLDSEDNPCAESESLDPAADYLVAPKQGTELFASGIRTCAGCDTVFSGHSLTIGDGSWSKGYARLYLSDSSPYTATFGNEGLRLEFGSISLLDTANATFDLYGKTTVLATGSGNSVFHVTGGNASYSGQTAVFHGPLCGESTAVLDVSFGIFGKIAITAFFMDVAQYHGTLRCGKDNTIGAMGESSASVTILSGGTFRTVTPTNDLRIASLTMETGSVFKVMADKWTDAVGFAHPTNALVRVTDSLSAGDDLGGKVVVSMSIADICFDGATNRFPLLAAPKSAHLSVARFALDFDTGVYPEDMRRLASLVVEEGDSEDVLAVVFQPTVRLLTGDNNKQTSRAEATTSMEDGKEAHWSDGRLPHAGAHYLVVTNGLSDAMMYLNTMGAGSGTDPGDYEARHFPGESLTIGGGCLLTIFQKPELRVKELRLLDGAHVRVGQGGGDTRIEGERVVVPDGNVRVTVYGSNNLEFTGDLHGPALVSIKGLGATSSPVGTMVFSGDNSEFTGRFFVSQPNYNKGPPTLSVQQTLQVSGTAQLGGMIPEMAWDGVWLERMSRLYVTNDAALAAGSNRGLYVDSTSNVADTDFYGRINVSAGKEFKVETQLTMNGHLRKEGAGTLTLAAPVKFGEGAVSDSPLASSNLLSVVAGSLKVGSSGGIDGLEVRFSAGTSLVRGAGSGADAEFLRYGIRNVKAATPFVLAEGETKLPLTVEYPATFPDGGQTIGILTVANSIAGAVRDMMPAVPRRVGGRNARLVEVVDAENAWTTFAVEISGVPGMYITIR